MHSHLSARCALCDEAMPPESLLEHLAQRHDFDVAGVRAWPDGEPMVVDETLEPEDFA